MLVEIVRSSFTGRGDPSELCSCTSLPTKTNHDNKNRVTRVYSSHESSSSRVSSSSHESGSSQVPIFFSSVFFFDYTNDVIAVTRNYINFPVVDIFHSRSKEPLPLRIAVASPRYTTTFNINTFSKNSKVYNLHMAEEHVPYT